MRKLEIILPQHANPEYAARWIFKVLSTITSNVFIKFTICFPPSYTARKNQARWWNSVDDALDRFRPRVDVTLVTTAQDRVEGGVVEDLVKIFFPSMSKDGKVVLMLCG